jgi:hypothetical protein
MTPTVELNTLKTNEKNPRKIKDKDFKKLVNNVLRYPSFLALRPIVHMERIIQGGNMRHRALEYICSQKKAGFTKLADEVGISMELIEFWEGIRKAKAIPAEWVKDAAGLTPDEVKAFIILDNRDFGTDDWDMLANEWDQKDLADWNVDVEKWNELLPTTKQVSFEVKQKVDDNHAVFEQVLLHADKKRLVEFLNKVKDHRGYEKLSDALMAMVDTCEENMSFDRDGT